MSDTRKALKDDELETVSAGTANNDLSPAGWYHYLGEKINIHRETVFGLVVSSEGEVTALGAAAYKVEQGMVVATRAIYIKLEGYSGWYPDDYSGRLFHNEKIPWPQSDAIDVYHGSK